MNFSGSFAGGNITSIFESLSSTINASEQAIPQALNQINNSANKSGGVLDPMAMSQIQMLMASYTSLIQMWSSIIKELGNLDKSIAQNIGV